MGDDREAAREAVEEALEPLEPVEVEVVRRLVEQEEVEAREQDRGEGGSSGLAARERRPSPDRARPGRPSSAQTRPRTVLEVATAEREVALERGRVGVGGSRSRCVAALPRVCGGDAGAPREVREQRLARPAVVLLRQVAGGERGRRRARRARVGLLDPGEQAQQRRLAGPVRADDAEPRSRPDRQVDAVENGLGAVRLDDAGE